MELIAAVSTTFNRRPRHRCISAPLFAFGSARLEIGMKFRFVFVSIVIVQQCVHGETRPCRLSRGQYGDDLGGPAAPHISISP